MNTELVMVDPSLTVEGSVTTETGFTAKSLIRKEYAKEIEDKTLGIAHIDGLEQGFFYTKKV